MRRRVRAAMAWSWVMMTTVVPGRVELLQQGQDGCAGGGVEVAGGLVGQQHRRGGRRSRGRWRPAAVPRPTAGWAGRRPGAPSPTRSSAAAASRRRWLRRMPAYSSPSATLPSTLWCSARKNCWNTNPIRDARSADSSPVGHRGRVQAGDAHRPGGRPVQRAHQVQQRGLARPGRARPPPSILRRTPPGSPGPAPAPAAAPGTPSTPGPAPALARPALAWRRGPRPAARQFMMAGTTTRSPGASVPGHLH